jgi:hypothetical protein
MDAKGAMSFVQEHGVVLVSAKGPIPCLTEAIAGEPIKGSWWAHSKSREIFSVLQKLGDSPDILSCRLVMGRVTFVHRRLWPALVRMAARFDPDQLAEIHEEHTSSGRHVNRIVGYPKWVPRDVMAEAQRLSESEAKALLGRVADLPEKSRKRGGRGAGRPARSNK